MSKYYIVSDELEKPKFDAHIEGTLLNNEKDVIPVIFNKGKSLYNFKDDVFFVLVDEDYTLPGKFRDKLSVVVNSSNYILVVSKKVQLMIEYLATEQVEFFDFVIQSKNTINDQYRVANVVNKISCIDYETSDLEFEFYEGEQPFGDILSVNSLVLKESEIPKGLNIFLLDGFKETIVVIHERLKEEIQKQDVSGFVFSNIDNFQL